MQPLVAFMHCCDKMQMKIRNPSKIETAERQSDYQFSNAHFGLPWMVE
jgi:hypothetical protein